MLPTDLIRQTDFFNEVSERSRKLLSDILIPKTLKKGSIIFNEGDSGHSVYLCGSGNIQLVKHNEDGKDTVIKLIGAGEMFAEVILFERNNYPVTAIALTRTTLYLLPKHQFLCLLEDQTFRGDFISNLMKKLRFLTQQIVNLTTLSVDERLLSFIMEHSNKSGEFDPLISKKEIASIIGTNPETLSRALALLRKKGTISTDGKKFFVTKKTEA